MDNGSWVSCRGKKGEYREGMRENGEWVDEAVSGSWKNEEYEVEISGWMKEIKWCKGRKWRIN